MEISRVNNKSFDGNIGKSAYQCKLYKTITNCTKIKYKKNVFNMAF